MYHIITLTPPPPNFRVITASSVSYNFSLHNKFSHTTRTERATRFCACFISSCLSYRGGKELFRIKVPSLPYDPTFLQKNRLGALPLRTPIIGGDFKGVAGGVTGASGDYCSPASPSLPLANWNKRHRNKNRDFHDKRVLRSKTSVRGS